MSDDPYYDKLISQHEIEHYKSEHFGFYGLPQIMADTTLTNPKYTTPGCEPLPEPQNKKLLLLEEQE